MEEDLEEQEAVPSSNCAWRMIELNVFNYGDSYRAPLSMEKYKLGAIWKTAKAHELLNIKQTIHYIQCHDREAFLIKFYNLETPENVRETGQRRRIENYFKLQGFTATKQRTLAKDIWNWITRATGKRATLRLYGPPNTGKTALASCIIRPWHTAVINTMQTVKNPNFMFQHTVGKSLILMEEPYFTIDVAEEMKKVMAANETQTDTKHGDMCTIMDIPILVTMNGTQFGHGLLGDQTERALHTRLISLHIKQSFEHGLRTIGELTHTGFYRWLWYHQHA